MKKSTWIVCVLVAMGCGEKNVAERKFVSRPNEQFRDDDNAAPAAQAGGQAKDEPTHEGKTVRQWTQDFNNQDKNVRKKAVEAIGLIGTKSDHTVTALIQALKHQDGRVRNEAVDQIQKLGSAAKAAVPALIITLKDVEADTRWDTCEALAAIGTEAKAAAPALTEALKDSHDNVRMKAAGALHKVDAEAAKKADALIQLVVAVNAVMKKSFTPEQVKLIKTALESKEDSKMLANWLGKDFDAFKKKLNETGTQNK